MNKIGLFGGSFNPIHHGHLIMARALAEHAGLSSVIFLPCGEPPHKDETDLIGSNHRGEMVRLAIAGEPLFSFSDYDLTRPGPAYTIETVRHFRSEFGKDTELYWIIGADTLRELPTWHLVGDLVDECRIVTAVRPGWTSSVWDALARTFSADQVGRLRAGVCDTPLIDISATNIRHRIADGQSVRYLVPEPVAAFVHDNDLYLA